VFLVDTFHTLKSGVPNAIKVAKELGDKINFVGIRLDSNRIPTKLILSPNSFATFIAFGTPDFKVWNVSTI
jgi:nicotinic acid phosphoribosyltransferase